MKTVWIQPITGFGMTARKVLYKVVDAPVEGSYVGLYYEVQTEEGEGVTAPKNTTVEVPETGITWADVTSALLSQLGFTAGSAPTPPAP